MSCVFFSCRFFSHFLFALFMPAYPYTDVSSYVPHLPTAGETLRATRYQHGFGGKGANECIAAAKLGSKTALISKVSLITFNFIQRFFTQPIILSHSVR